MEYLILLPILLAFILGAFTFKIEQDEKVTKFALISTTLVSIVAVFTLYFAFGKEITVLKFNDLISFGFKIDALSVVFALMVSFLWPLATLYATKYMTHEGKMPKFFMFYTMTFGTVLALAFSKNMLTMYLFYEILTFITLPLVMHGGKAKDSFAGKKYIIYSVSGAATAFVGMMVFLEFGGSLEFGTGISIPQNNMLLVAYVLMFVGFAVKTGIFPFHGWLIGAGVAPTTVTALLHAVAVVKAGAFATMRVTYSLYDPSYLSGTWAQYATMSLVIITIVFGSSMALKSSHMKRRFAYSTISQLSYILLGVVSMSYVGLVAGIFHMIYHALIKIVIFYSAGNIIFSNHKDYVKDIEGYGTLMPITFITFTISSLSLIGIPPLGGFLSKIALIESSISVGGVIGFLAVSALMISALLTAMYLLQIVVLAFMPHHDFDIETLNGVKESPKEMTIPMVVITATMVLLSLFSNQLYSALQNLFLGGF